MFVTQLSRILFLFLTPAVAMAFPDICTNINGHKNMYYSDYKKSTKLIINVEAGRITGTFVAPTDNNPNNFATITGKCQATTLTFEWNMPNFKGQFIGILNYNLVDKVLEIEDIVATMNNKQVHINTLINDKWR